ncbi:hypothetical protein BDW59DRAFT_167682 [Aspergillus cavernicola]|uniref:Uncharacterized protein n=1 Tax=Aspergillus cavernicola TaxID=176166 RepID=A0ABR4HBP7_9EURO
MPINFMDPRPIPADTDVRHEEPKLFTEEYQFSGMEIDLSMHFSIAWKITDEDCQEEGESTVHMVFINDNHLELSPVISNPDLPIHERHMNPDPRISGPSVLEAIRKRPIVGSTWVAKYQAWPNHLLFILWGGCKGGNSSVVPKDKECLWNNALVAVRDIQFENGRYIQNYQEQLRAMDRIDRSMRSAFGV